MRREWLSIFPSQCLMFNCLKTQTCKHDAVINPSWQEADQLATYKGLWFHSGVYPKTNSGQSGTGTRVNCIQVLRPYHKAQLPL